MGSKILILFLGLVMAMPLIHILEITGHGAIALLIFLCTGIVGTVIAMVKIILKRGKKTDAIHSIKS